MKDLANHVPAMLELLKDYTTREGLLDEVSCLLIVRQVQQPNEPEQHLSMAVVGEDCTTAIQTLHYAAVVIREELRRLAQITNGGVKA